MAVTRADDRVPQIVREAARIGVSFTSPVLAPHRRFLILCQGRTGSELLVDLLNQHPNIACDSEIMADRHHFPNRYVEYRAVRRRGPGVTTYGYKLILQQLRWGQPIHDPRAWLQSQIDNGTTLISLDRQNLLDQAISFTRATIQDWHHTQDALPPDVPLALDPVDVIAHLSLLGEALLWFNDLLVGMDSLHLIYEDDLFQATDQQRTANSIFAALGLPAIDVQAGLVRSATADPREAVSNFDEIADIVLKSKFKQFVEMRGAP
jgi:LPS sulfotransferase NodH